MARVGKAVRVHGLVQGVFYRAWTVEQAHELGVTGWVRNSPDGSVEAHIAGDEPAIDKMIERLRRGPPDARVASLTETDVAPEPGDSFVVRRS